MPARPTSARSGSRRFGGAPASGGSSKVGATEASSRLSGDGRPTLLPSCGGSATWRLVSIDGASESAGGIEEGVHFAADSFARVFAASGGSIDNVTVDVSGISNLDAYAATLNYLESMTLVRGVSLEQVMRDTLRFRLSVRGDAATLKRAIALDRRLVPIEDGGTTGTEAAATNRLSFRYQP